LFDFSFFLSFFGLDPAFVMVLESTWTFLLALFEKKTDSGNRHQIVDILRHFATASENLRLSLQDDVKNPLVQYKDAMFSFFVEALSSQSQAAKVTGLHGLQSLYLQQPLLSPAQVFNSYPPSPLFSGYLSSLFLFFFFLFFVL